MKAIRCIEDGVILLVDDNSIKEGYLHDTYGRYGQSVSSYEAGNLCFEQNDFLEAAKAEAVEKLGSINWHNYNIEVIGDTEIDVIAEDDDESEFAAKITKVMNTWAEDNYNATSATYINYWDGNNWQSIVITSGEGDNEFYEILEDEEAEKFIDMYKSVEWSAWSYGKRSASVDGYIITQSQFASDFETASIEKDATSIIEATSKKQIKRAQMHLFEH